ncbi:DUF1800 domain-containing protein [Marinicella rhabdoformis]|uniref:DUF1800 domain-containing protein n=1 Tax=Marinicella rhabdoformis TaxID=2580566 RepID=UPI0012AEC46F|nr:DUF1800 domain-containing protein [Marinicella rhabdoformis]
MGIFKEKYIPRAERSERILSQLNKNKFKKSQLTLRQKRQASLKANSTYPNFQGAAASPDLIHLVLSKMAFGPSPEDASHIQSLPGANNEAKVLSYIDEQLNYENIDDSYADSLLQGSNGFTTLNKTRKQLYQQHVRRPDGNPIDWEDHIRPGRETVAATFIRSVHSKRQLFETMTDFWHNHFSVYQYGDSIQGMFVEYDRDVIRANALGNFHDMLYAMTRSTCMMMYLGNALNNVTEPNENFARELMELHTLGAENYYGHMDPADVPEDGNGQKMGYVERDVYYLARALTGWSYDGAHWSDDDDGHAPTGNFKFREDWHYDGISRVLGEYYEFDAAFPLGDVRAILKMLAAHPGTAKFLATKLCRRFISDSPPQNVVAQVADVLQQNWNADDQIKQAMDVLLKSPEFLSTWGEKIKRPFEKSVSVMRQIGFNFTFNPTESTSNTHRWIFDESGGYPFSWSSPNGYPDTKSHWLGSSAQMMTWRYIQWFCQDRDDDNGNIPYNNILEQTEAAFPNSNDITANNLVDYWYERLCGVSPDSHSRDKLAQFMSLQHLNDGNPIGRNEPIDLSENSWPEFNLERLMALVSMICMTAEFSYR